MQISLRGIANKAKRLKESVMLMRKRVLLKSPLRENRTAGSVRGTPGNWRSYRNNEKKRRLEDKKLEGWKEEWEWQRIYCLTFGSKFDIFFLKR